MHTMSTWFWHKQWVWQVHDAVKESGWVLPHRSDIFHVYTSADTPWVAWTLSHFTSVKWGKVSSNPSAHEDIEFGDSICPVCVSTFKCLLIQIQPTRALTDTGGGYYLAPVYFRLDHSSSFASRILPFPLIARPVSNYSNISIILLNYIGPPSIERALSWADSNHLTSTVCLYN
jgi:hypothetical protein